MEDDIDLKYEPYPDKIDLVNKIFTEGRDLKQNDSFNTCAFNYISKKIKISDFPKKLISEDFTYSEAVDKISKNIPQIENELKTFSLDSPTKENIFKAQEIQSFVEDKFNNNIDFKEQIVKDIFSLSNNIDLWRKVKEDGNDFYRSVMFSWLEYLIFNNKINILKILISNLYVKFNPNYINTKKLGQDLIKQFINEKFEVSIIVLEIIIQHLSKGDNENAYKTLIKAYNSSKAFDQTMIYYLRYLIYEFLLENKNNINDLYLYLPRKYLNLEGDYVIEDYCKNNLLKYSTSPEDFIICLAPYVLKININLIKYKYNDKEDKESDIRQYFLWNGFSEERDINDSINILYDYSRYYICYLKKFSNKNTALLIYYDFERQEKYIVDMNEEKAKKEKEEKEKKEKEEKEKKEKEEKEKADLNFLDDDDDIDLSDITD